MRPTSLLSALTRSLGLAGHRTWAAPGGATKADAVAMVQKGVAFIKGKGKAKGKEKGHAEIISTEGLFHRADLYLVYGLDGRVHAHGVNAKMVGKNLIGMKDMDGKPFVKGRVELGKSKPSLWQDCPFANPETKKVEPKSKYCQRQDDSVVGGGIYT